MKRNNEIKHEKQCTTSKMIGIFFELLVDALSY